MSEIFPVPVPLPMHDDPLPPLTRGGEPETLELEHPFEPDTSAQYCRRAGCGLRPSAAVHQRGMQRSRVVLVLDHHVSVAERVVEAVTEMFADDPDLTLVHVEQLP